MSDREQRAPSLVQLCSLHFASLIGNGRVPPIDCSLPIEVGDDVVLALRQKGLLSGDSLATLAKTPLKISRFDASGAALSLESLTALNKYPDIVSVNISNAAETVEESEKFDLAVFVNSCLHERAARNLRHLNVGGVNRVYGYQALSQLLSLESLSLSGRPVCQSWLGAACRLAPQLTMIDITGTAVTDITWLDALSRLEVLIMHNVSVRSGSAQDTLAGLSQLRVLDISKKVTDFAGDGSQESHVDLALAVVQVLSEPSLTSAPWPHLQSIDMAGNALAGLGVDQAIQMVDTVLRGCPAMRQVSVMATPLDGHTYVSPVDRPVTIINCATRQKSIDALKHYWHTDRDVFTSHALHSVYYCLQSSYDDFTDVEVQDCAVLVCRAMKRHLRNIGVQMAGSACLYHLCKMKRIRRLNVSQVQECMDRCLDAAESYRQMVQLQKNVWLTICNDYLLQLPGVDFYRTCKVALESMLCSRDSAVARMTIAIVSIVTPKMRPPEAKELTGDERYVKHLVLLMNDNLRHLLNTPGPRAENSLFTLKFTLSALWNLTDESSSTCAVFFEAGGVLTCFEILTIFPDHYNIQTKVLGILNNVAEVPELKEEIVQNEQWLSTLCNCLDGNFEAREDGGRNRTVERSYFAAGVLANILVAKKWVPTPRLMTKDHINCQLVKTIMSWPVLQGAMVSYRSFEPFVRILSDVDYSGAQMWCLWGVNHVLKHKEKNAAAMDYHTMLRQSHVPQHCQLLLQDASAHHFVRQLAGQIESAWLRSSEEAPSMADDTVQLPVEAAA